MRTTIIYAPHPDDETLYLGSYITVCAARGDRLVLIAVTDGTSSGARPAAWTYGQLATVRTVEQEAAWWRLTNGKGTVRRLGLIDSKDPDLRNKIHALAEELEAEFSVDSDVEHYAACNNGHSQGVDHDAVALGLRDALVRVARFANRCTDTGGTIYKPADLGDMQAADESFKAFGHYSVPTYWKSYRDSGYTNRVVG